MSCFCDAIDEDNSYPSRSSNGEGCDVERKSDTRWMVKSLSLILLRAEETGYRSAGLLAA